MQLYIVTYRGWEGTGEHIVKVFSSKEKLDQWLVYADQMERELFGSCVDLSSPMSRKYKIKEVELDNLDFISLLAEARDLGAQVKPSQQQ
jgi:hypothetical protein